MRGERDGEASAEPPSSTNLQTFRMLGLGRSLTFPVAATHLNLKVTKQTIRIKP